MGCVVEAIGQRRGLAAWRSLDAESDALIGDGLALLGAVAAECPEYARPLHRAWALIERGLELDGREDAPLDDCGRRAVLIATHGRAIGSAVERLTTGRGGDGPEAA